MTPRETLGFAAAVEDRGPEFPLLYGATRNGVVRSTDVTIEWESLGETLSNYMQIVRFPFATAVPQGSDGIGFSAGDLDAALDRVLRYVEGVLQRGVRLRDGSRSWCGGMTEFLRPGFYRYVPILHVLGDRDLALYHWEDGGLDKYDWLAEFSLEVQITPVGA